MLFTQTFFFVNKFPISYHNDCNMRLAVIHHFNTIPSIYKRTKLKNIKGISPKAFCHIINDYPNN